MGAGAAGGAGGGAQKTPCRIQICATYLVSLAAVMGSAACRASGSSCASSVHGKKTSAEPCSGRNATPPRAGAQPREARLAAHARRQRVEVNEHRGHALAARRHALAARARRHVKSVEMRQVKLAGQVPRDLRAGRWEGAGGGPERRARERAAAPSLARQPPPRSPESAPASPPACRCTAPTRAPAASACRASLHPSSSLRKPGGGQRGASITNAQRVFFSRARPSATTAALAAAHALSDVRLGAGDLPAAPSTTMERARPGSPAASTRAHSSGERKPATRNTGGSACTRSTPGCDSSMRMKAADARPLADNVGAAADMSWPCFNNKGSQQRATTGAAGAQNTTGQRTRGQGTAAPPTIGRSAQRGARVKVKRGD